MKNKKNKPLFTRIMNGIVKTLIAIVVLAILVAAAGAFFLHYKYGVNAIDLTGELISINKSVDEGSLVTEKFTGEDLSAASEKAAATSFSSHVIRFTEKEIAAYFADKLANNGGISLDLQRNPTVEKLGLKVLQVEFTDIPSEGERYAEVRLVYNLSSEAAREVTGYPEWLFYRLMPKNITVTSLFYIDKDSSSAYGYKVVPEEIKYNGMSAEKTADLSSSANSVYGISKAEELNAAVGRLFAETIIGSETYGGIYSSLEEHGAEGYGFAKVSGENCFEIYDYTINSSFSIIYNDLSGAENSNPTEYKISNGIIELKDLSRNGYAFEGWYTLPVGGEKITEIDSASAENYSLYARWQIETYTITYELSGAENSPLNIGTYTVETPTLILHDPAGREYYDFKEWQSGGEKITEIAHGSFGNITVTAVWTPVEFDINYELDGADNGANPVTYNVETAFTLEDPVKHGYEFTGWSGTEIEETSKSVTVSAGSHGNRSYVAHFEIITYSITYNLNGGTVSVENPTEYTVETPDFTLNDPEKEYAEFLGWTVNGSAATTPYVVRKGTYGDLNAVATFDDVLKSVTFNVGGRTVLVKETAMGSALNSTLVSALFVPSEAGMTGYSVERWYSDPAMETEFTEVTLLDNVALYGEWSYILDEISFVPYAEEFENAVSSGSLEVGTRDELKAYIDFVRFYDITKQVKIKFNYTVDDIMEEIESACNECVDESDFRTGSGFTYGVEGSRGKFYATTTTRGEIATETLDEGKTQVCAQQEYAFRLSAPASPRTDDFDGFKINNVDKTVKVNDTEQLWYVIEHGYRPLCVSGSPAETAYNKAKTALRRIITDDMTDETKLRAIYEWLIFNVDYDNKALVYAESVGNSSADLRKYKSWALEGVFDDGVAVCEGYAKSFITMAKIEGIPAIYVTGNGHAWNRVMVNGKWYGFDATHGNPKISDTEEGFTYTSFLFTDANKTGKGYSSEDFKEFAAVTEYNYYETVSFGDEGQEFDLYVNDIAELNRLLSYVKAYADERPSENVIFEFSASITVSDPVVKAVFVGYEFYSYEVKTDSCGNNVYTYMIKA